MSVLLRQLHGFEGFVLVAVLVDFDDLAVAQSGEMRFADLHGRAALPASAPESNTGNHLVAHDQQLLHFGLDVRDALAAFGEQPAVSVVTPVRLDDQLIRRGPPLDAGVNGGEARFKIATVKAS